MVKANMLIVAVKEDIVRRLEDMAGETAYVCDIGFSLTESENATGSWYCSTFKAKEDIANNFELFGAAVEYMRSEWGDTTNPLLEPELFHVKAMICLYGNMFNVAVSDLDNWNDEIEIDDDFIQSVKDGLVSICGVDDIF